MKKSELIDILFDEFIRDKDLIKNNLMMFMDSTYIQVKDKTIKITLKVDVEHIK